MRIRIDDAKCEFTRNGIAILERIAPEFHRDLLLISG
jgi:hypothetical protein